MMNDKETSMTNVFEKGIITGISRVRWSSAAGVKEGLVTRMDHARNKRGDMIQWLSIKLDDAPKFNVRIPVTSCAQLRMNVI